MKKYLIKAQFADPSGPEFPKINEAIERAIKFYNQHSLIASNPKKIVEYRIFDARTLELVLESQTELRIPGKALQTFSRYLISEGSFNQYIYGKQLFKMSSEEIGDSNSPAKSEGVAVMRLRAISQIIRASEEKLTRIMRILEEE